MSEALIRKCNKCSAPFIKENGCNKVCLVLPRKLHLHEPDRPRQMTCTKCRNIQCYICSKSCDYSHFNDERRGGKNGNCDLFDKEGIEVRHREEVRVAEEVAREKAKAQHKDLNPVLLEFQVSEAVKKADEMRRNAERKFGRFREAWEWF